MSDEVSPSLSAAIAAAWDASANASEDAAPVAADAAPEAEAPAPEAAPDDFDEAVGFDRDEWNATPQTAREKAKALAAARSAAEERAKAYEPLESILAPRRDSLRAVYGSDAKGVEQLLHLSDWATRDFPGFVRHMAENRGIDLRSLVPATPQQAQQPDVATLIRQEAERVISERETTNALTAFEGNTALEHRADPSVRAIMAGVLQSGAANDYATAYQMAIKAHPEYGPKHLAAEAAARAKAELEARANDATAKQAAAVSVRGSPGTSRAASAASAPVTVRDAAMAAWASVEGRV